MIIFLNDFCFSQEIKEIIDFHYKPVAGQNRGASYFQIEAEVVYQNDSVAIYTERIYNTSKDMRNFSYSTSIKDNIFIGTRCFSIGELKHCKTEDSIPILLPFNYNSEKHLSKRIDTTYALYFSRILHTALETSLYYENNDTSLVYRFMILENDTAKVFRIQANQEGWIMVYKKICLTNIDSNHLFTNEIVNFSNRNLKKLNKILNNEKLNRIPPGLFIHFPDIFIEIRNNKNYYIRFKNESELNEQYPKGLKRIKKILFGSLSGI